MRVRNIILYFLIMDILVGKVIIVNVFVYVSFYKYIGLS